MSFWPFLISSMSAGLAPHAASVTTPRSAVRTDLLSMSHLPGWSGLKREAPRVSRPRLPLRAETRINRRGNRRWRGPSRRSGRRPHARPGPRGHLPEPDHDPRYGRTPPIASNKTEAGRAENRRAGIVARLTRAGGRAGSVLGCPPLPFFLTAGGRIPAPPCPALFAY